MLWSKAAGAGGTGGASSALSPLFSQGEEGLWYDISDLSTLWQDSDGTQPSVPAQEGQTPTASSVVGRIDDKSGNDCFCIQPNGSEKPYLVEGSDGRHFLSFGGSDDSLVVQNLSANAGPVTMAAGFVQNRNEILDYIFDVDVGRLILGARTNVTNASGVYTGSSWEASATSTNTRYIMTGLMRSSGVLRINGSQTNSFSMTQRALGGNIRVGSARNGGGENAFQGRLYGLVIRAADTIGDDLALLESYLAEKTGVTL